MEVPQPWTSEQFRAAVAETAAAPARTDALLLLLAEEHPSYSQCGAAEVARRRGWLLVELGRAPLEGHALPLVLEELETGYVPYLLAAAARALRQAQRPMARFAPAVFRALDALTSRDDVIDLDRWGGLATGGYGRTALDEVLATLRWLGPHASGIRDRLVALLDGPCVHTEEHEVALREVLAALPEPVIEDNSPTCCNLPLPWRRNKAGARSVRVEGISFEDQNGRRRTWSEVFCGQPSVVAFFYTRCDNDLKCSLTIGKLAHVQRMLAAAGQEQAVKIAAITYDPDFDLPHRLRRYAQSRGVVPGERCLMLRAVSARDDLRCYFASGVNFVGSLVNRHRIEVFVLDSSGRIASTYQRLAWEPAQVVSDLRSQVTAGAPTAPLAQTTEVDGRRHRFQTSTKLAPTLWAVLLALLPKCPVCGATYLSLTGIAALPHLQGWIRSWPLVVALLFVNLAALVCMARSSGRWGPVWWAGAGAAFLIGPGLALGNASGMALGLATCGIGSALGVVGGSHRVARSAHARAATAMALAPNDVSRG